MVDTSVHTLSRKGICDGAATSRRVSAATAVYCRTLSDMSEDLGSIAEDGKNTSRTCKIYMCNQYIFVVVLPGVRIIPAAGKI
jgi:hypothetical protein